MLISQISCCCADVTGRNGTSCTVLENTDFQDGIVINDGKAEKADTDAECCAKCNLLYGMFSF